MTSILVAFASKHGATQGIAERVGETLVASGQKVEVRPIKDVRNLADHDAFVIGGAAYMGAWIKEATEFVRRNRDVLVAHPVWLFSSGPLGSEPKDAQGRDLLEVSEPKELVSLRETIKPHSARVFFGALDPRKLGLSERLLRSLPAGRKLMPKGDFRGWQEIDAWAQSIAQELAGVPARSG
jgi:menaquinone-dependent protoporphyrinogen oxidase